MTALRRCRRRDPTFLRGSSAYPSARLVFTFYALTGDSPHLSMLLLCDHACHVELFQALLKLATGV